MEKVPPYSVEDGHTDPPPYQPSALPTKGRAMAYVEQPQPVNKKLMKKIQCYRSAVGVMSLFAFLALALGGFLVWYAFFRAEDFEDFAWPEPQSVQCENGGSRVWQETGQDVCMCPEYAKGDYCQRLLRDCDDVQAAGYLYSGVYSVLLGSRTVQVYCDMLTEDLAWTVLMRRADGSEDFERNWDDYKHGFGRPDSDFWIGNDVMHLLTENDLGYNYQLRVDMELYNGTRAYAEYRTFSVAGEADNYKLSADHYLGNAGDSLARHYDSAFTTLDREHDTREIGNCASSSGGWWYADCFNVKLTGIYGQDLEWRGIIWRSFGDKANLKYADMKIRAPRTFDDE